MRSESITTTSTLASFKIEPLACVHDEKRGINKEV